MIEIRAFSFSSFQPFFTKPLIHFGNKVIGSDPDVLKRQEKSRMMIAHGAHCRYYLNQLDHKYFGIPVG